MKKFRGKGELCSEGVLEGKVKKKLREGELMDVALRFKVL